MDASFLNGFDSQRLVRRGCILVLLLLVVAFAGGGFLVWLCMR